MTPIRFGPSGRQLFGLHLVPDGGPNNRAGVLLCNPFGQEAIRCHRLFKVLGDRIVRQGFHVMRFDYFGTGDSDGDDHEGDLESWMDGVLRADEELARRSGCTSISWFGLRLGGSLAALASAHSTRKPGRLILWNPIIDGPAYLAELTDAHIRARMLDFGPRWKIESRLQAMILRESESEAFGFPLTPALKAQIGALSVSSLGAARAAGATVFYEGDSSHVSELVQSLEAHSVSATALRIETGISWTTNEAMNSAIVPVAVLNGVLDAVQAVP